MVLTCISLMDNETVFHVVFVPRKYFREMFTKLLWSFRVGLFVLLLNYKEFTKYNFLNILPFYILSFHFTNMMKILENYYLIFSYVFIYVECLAVCIIAHLWEPAHICTHTCECGSPVLMLGIFIPHHLIHWSTVSLLNPEFPYTAGPASQPVLGLPCLCLLGIGITNRKRHPPSISVGSGHLNSASHVCMASPFTTGHFFTFPTPSVCFIVVLVLKLKKCCQKKKRKENVV